MKFVTSWILSLILGLALSVSALAVEDYPEITEESLHKINDTDLTLVFAKPGVDLSVYDKVLLLDATVAFKKNWQREQNSSSTLKVSARDMDRIKSSLAELFREVFTDKLNAAGHELVSESADDVLIVRPAIVDLDVVAPDKRSAGSSFQFSQSAGEMTLYIELYDSMTGDILARAMDRKTDRRQGYFKWQTKGGNLMASKKIINTWAGTLVSALNDARAVAGGFGNQD